MTDTEDRFRDDLARLATATMPFGKFKGRAVADLPATISHGSPAKGFLPANSDACWR